MHVRDLKRRSVGATALLALALGVAFGVDAVPRQQAKLVAADPVIDAGLGGSVAIAGDTAVIGALGRVGGNCDGRGAVYVFSRSPSAEWSQQAKLAAADVREGDLGNCFGIAVAVEGDTVVVGASDHFDHQGAAYVFAREGTTWAQQAKLVAADGQATRVDAFGASVAVSGDTAVVGAPISDNPRGAAYVFTRTGATWTQEARLVAAGNFDLFGASVGIAGDTAVVGASHYADRQGAVYVFRRTGTTWTREAELTPADAQHAGFFGSTVAIAGDTVVVGGRSTGGAYVFRREGTAWALEAKLTSPDAPTSTFFGSSVAIAGGKAVVGTIDMTDLRGAAYVFTRAGTTWTLLTKLTAADGHSSDRFGDSVAVAGETAVAGASGMCSGRGAAYVFSASAVVTPPPESPGYCSPVKVATRTDTRHPERSTLTASGTLDTGTADQDFSGAATLDVGGFHLDVPSFVAKRGTLRYAAGGISLTIKPSRSGSSRATFRVKVAGDLAGKVGLDAPLTFDFRNGAHALHGSARLSAGAAGTPGVTAPDLHVLEAHGTIKGCAKDAIKLTLGFAGDGVVPPVAGDLRIGVGTYTSPLLASASFVREGEAWVLEADSPGVTKAVLDYAKGTVTIAAKDVDLGAFAEGGNPVLVTVGRGGDTRTARIRMTRAGAKLSY